MADYNIDFKVDDSYIVKQTAIIKLFVNKSLIDTVKEIDVNDFKLLTDDAIMRKFNYDMDILIDAVAQQDYDETFQEKLLNFMMDLHGETHREFIYKLKHHFIKQDRYNILFEPYSISDNLNNDYEFIIKNYSIDCIKHYYSFYNVGKIFKGENIETIGHKFILEFMGSTRLRARIKLVSPQLEQELERIIERHTT